MSINHQQRPSRPLRNHWKTIASDGEYSLAKQILRETKRTIRIRQLTQQNQQIRNVVQAVWEKQSLEHKIKNVECNFQKQISSLQCQLKNAYRKINMQEEEIQRKKQVNIMSKIHALSKQIEEKKQIRVKLAEKVIALKKQFKKKQKQIVQKEKKVNQEQKGFKMLHQMYDDTQYIKEKIKQFKKQEQKKNDLALRKNQKIKELQNILLQQNYPQNEIQKIKFRCIHNLTQSRTKDTQKNQIKGSLQEYQQMLRDIELLNKVNLRTINQYEAIIKQTTEHKNQVYFKQQQIYSVEAQIQSLEKILIKPKQIIKQKIDKFYSSRTKTLGQKFNRIYKASQEANKANRSYSFKNQNKIYNE